MTSDEKAQLYEIVTDEYRKNAGSPHQADSENRPQSWNYGDIPAFDDTVSHDSHDVKRKLSMQNAIDSIYADVSNTMRKSSQEWAETFIHSGSN